MDLLRLVLARQPVDSLIRFPFLLRSRKFLLTRITVLGNREVNTENYLDSTIADGELTSLSVVKVGRIPAQARAIFLRNPGSYRHFVETDPIEIDLWLALGSGIPEIQATALSRFRGQFPDEYQWEVIAGYADLLDIPWTEQLRAATGTLLGSLTVSPPQAEPTRLKLTHLAGFLGVAVDFSKIRDYIYIGEYFTGTVLNRLQGKEVTEKDEDIEKIARQLYVSSADTVKIYMATGIPKTAVSCGYLYPLIEIAKKNKSFHGIPELYNQAALYGSETMLWELRNRDRDFNEEVFAESHRVTRNHVRRYIAILESKRLDLLKRLVNMLLICTGVDVEENYKAIYLVRLNVAIPSWGLPSSNRVMTRGRSRSIQSAVYYAPDIVLKEMRYGTRLPLMYREAYKRGLPGNYILKQPEPDVLSPEQRRHIDSIRPPLDPGIYERTLRYLTGEAHSL